MDINKYLEEFEFEEPKLLTRNDIFSVMDFLKNVVIPTFKNCINEMNKNELVDNLKTYCRIVVSNNYQNLEFNHLAYLLKFTDFQSTYYALELIKNKKG